MNLFSYSNNVVFRSIAEPIRENKSFEERWHGDDKGLITAWEVGRELAKHDKNLFEKVKKGELPPLGFKGGHHKRLKNSISKYGTLHYLAELQGLKDQNLDIDFTRDEKLTLTCSKTKMQTIFTSNQDFFKDT